MYLKNCFKVAAGRHLQPCRWWYVIPIAKRPISYSVKIFEVTAELLRIENVQGNGNLATPNLVKISFTVFLSFGQKVCFKGHLYDRCSELHHFQNLIILRSPMTKLCLLWFSEKCDVLLDIFCSLDMITHAHRQTDRHTDTRGSKYMISCPCWINSLEISLPFEVRDHSLTIVHWIVQKQENVSPPSAEMICGRPSSCRACYRCKLSGLRLVIQKEDRDCVFVCPLVVEMLHYRHQTSPAS